MPPPGEIELRESSSPVPAQMMFGLDGAMAMSPIEMTFSPVNSGKNCTPPLMVFQIPPAAAAT
jgi:hypothetical protein